MKGIFKFCANVGRIGNLNGIFVSNSKDIQSLIDSEREIYFGECLGKHSDISFPLNKEYFSLVSYDSNFINMFESAGMESGTNPMKIYRDSLADGCYSEF